MFGRNKFGIIIVQAMSQRMNVYVCVCVVNLKIEII